MASKLETVNSVPNELLSVPGSDWSPDKRSPNVVARDAAVATARKVIAHVLCSPGARVPTTHATNCPVGGPLYVSGQVAVRVKSLCEITKGDDDASTFVAMAGPRFVTTNETVCERV
jgi:hypothetical protein